VAGLAEKFKGGDRTVQTPPLDFQRGNDPVEVERVFHAGKPKNGAHC